MAMHAFSEFYLILQIDRIGSVWTWWKSSYSMKASGKTYSRAPYVRNNSNSKCRS